MTQIGKYEVVRRTGETPLGTVYEAFDPSISRTVSIQISGVEDSGKDSPRRQTGQVALQKGGESLGRLNHPNIRNIIATEEADGTIYLVMEHVTSQPLSQRAVNGELKPIEVVSLLKMAGSALDHAHVHGVVHPGLTPQHLLVDEAGLLKVAGFEMSGLQDVPEEQMENADVELLLNSIPYRGPEFLIGERNDSRADQFSLALIAFELLTGHRGYNQPSALDAMRAIVSGELPDLKLLEGRMPGAARRVFERALAGDPAVRYSSCPDMLLALEGALLRQPASATKATPALEVAGSRTTGLKQKGTNSARISEELANARSKGSRRLKILLIAACLAVAVIAGMIFLELRPVAPPASVTATPLIVPADAPTAASNQQIEDIAKKVVEQNAVKARASTDDSGNSNSEANAVPRKASKASAPKKQKRQKDSPDLDMGEVRVGR